MVKIDLVYFNATNVEWPYGKTFPMQPNSVAISHFVNNELNLLKGEWLLFWDYNLGKPPMQFLELLTAQPVDVWHAGLKLGLQDLPQALNYIDPAWLYNKNAPDNIISSSFRLSIRACLVKTSTLKMLPDVTSGYQSLEMIGISLGYTLIKMGAVICHHPLLVPIEENKKADTSFDEWIFIKRFFPKKWQLWVLFNKGFSQNYKYWKATKAITLYLKPSIHRSDLPITISRNETVSVLAPTLDRYPYLESELEQLSVQTHIPAEVLITDQTDSESRTQINTHKYAGINIRYFPQDEKGQCTAWNKLLAEAQGEYVLFLGDDADNIRPDFIAKLFNTMHQFDADMVASNVIELKAKPREINHHFYLSDTFPITLIKRDLVIKAGIMDMFFNKNIRADYDLALRCHELGARMIFDSSALIDHHRAPSGGLRAHKARVITNASSKKSISQFAEPTVSEIFLVLKHFDKLQFRNFIRIKFFEQLVVKGSIFRKAVRVFIFLIKLPGIIKRYKANVSIAKAELETRKLN